jgi:murein DD-endopeptidase MepM/ murein hydrolase activator NlpD
MFQQRQRLRWMWFVLFLAVTGFGLLWAESEVQGGSAHSLQQATIPGGSELFLPLVQPEPGSGAPATMIYTVQPGDTLFSIARRFGTTVEELVELNNLADPRVIRVGQQLLVPAITPPPPTRIQFAPGATSATVTGTVEFPLRDEYLVRALAGQQMTVTISSPGDVANFAVQGVDDGQPYKRLESESRTWSSLLPSTQDYLVSVAVPAGASEYTLEIIIVTPGTTGPVWSDPAAQIELFSPQANGLYHSPIEVIGFSQTFEGSVNLRLTAADGTVLAERHTQGGSVDGFDFFHSYLRFTVSEQISGTLEVFEISAKDGSEIHKVTVPLVLLPGQRVLDLNRPEVGAAVCSPIFVNGYSNTFEASLLVDLRTRAGTLITQTVATGGNLGVYADFSATLRPDVAAPQPVLVSAFEAAASGAGDVDRTSIPLSLYPPGSSQCP